MTIRFHNAIALYLALAGLRPLSAHRVRTVVIVALAVCPSIVCARLAENSGAWDLFERSGSITTAIGLLVASRRYIQHGVLELAALQANEKLRSNVAEVLEEILTAKLGLALSAFGTIIWGWGKYIGWWSFAYLLVWALFALRDARHDFARVRSQFDLSSGDPSEAVRNGSG